MKAAGALFFAILILGGCSKSQVRSTDALTAAEHVQLGQSYERQNLMQEAEREYEAALKQNPKEISALISLGNLKFERRKYGAAEDLFERVLKLSPRHAGAINNLAMIAVREKSGLEEWEKRVREVLFEAGPLRPYLYDTLANIYILQKRYADADRSLQEAAALAPSGDAHFHQKLQESRERLNSARGLGDR